MNSGLFANAMIEVKSVSSQDRKITALTLSVCLILMFSAHRAMGQQATSVPKALCGAQDRTETVQGQTTLAERFSAGPQKAYQCNLELVGQFEGEGASFGYADFERCAYYSTAQNPTLRNRGVTVLDVSDTMRPKSTMHLDSPVMIDAIETLETSSIGGVLLAGSTAQTPGRTSPFVMELYDVSRDCRRPVLKSTLALPDNMYAHTGQFTSDGRTYYGAKWPPDPKFPPISAVFAIDVQDAAAARYLAAWIPPDQNWITHHVSLNATATRAYVAIKRPNDDAEKSPLQNGLVILDVSEIQARKTNPAIRLISRLFWDETHFGQFTVPVTIGGKPYVVFTDIRGGLGAARPIPSGACNSKKPNHGFARIIDVGDESHPKTVARLMLEVHDPARCSDVMHDPAGFGGYGTAGCSADNPQDATLLACSYFESGLRVFDIRDPSRPREVAYYKPPARRKENRPGSLLRPMSGATVDYTADAVAVMPRFHGNGREIWFVSFDNGFQIVRFTDHFKQTYKELLRRRPAS